MCKSLGFLPTCSHVEGIVLGAVCSTNTNQITIPTLSKSITWLGRGSWRSKTWDWDWEGVTAGLVSSVTCGEGWRVQQRHWEGWKEEIAGKGTLVCQSRGWLGREDHHINLGWSDKLSLTKGDPLPEREDLNSGPPGLVLPLLWPWLHPFQGELITDWTCQNGHTWKVCVPWVIIIVWFYLENICHLQTMNQMLL